MIEIYWASGSPMAWPIQIALREKEIPHRSININFSDGDNKTPEFLARNPRGKVPVLMDGDVAVYESHAIMDYLERYFPKVPLLPSDKAGAAADLSRRLEINYIYPAADAAISYTSYSSALRREDWDRQRLETLSEPLVQEFQRWDSYLDGRQWLGRDDGPGQSDIFFIPLLMYMNRFGFDYQQREFSNLARYFAVAKQRPSVTETWPPHWLTSDGDPTFAIA